MKNTDAKKEYLEIKDLFKIGLIEELEAVTMANEIRVKLGLDKKDSNFFDFSNKTFF